MLRGSESSRSSIFIPCRGAPKALILQPRAPFLELLLLLLLLFFFNDCTHCCIIIITISIKLQLAPHMLQIHHLWLDNAAIVCVCLCVCVSCVVCHQLITLCDVAALEPIMSCQPLKWYLLTAHPLV